MTFVQAPIEGEASAEIINQSSDSEEKSGDFEEIGRQIDALKNFRMKCEEKL